MPAVTLDADGLSHNSNIRMNKTTQIVAAAALAALTLPVAAQTNGSNSPYSRYGFGLLNDGSNAFNIGMSGTAYGMRNGTEVNTKNPASYAAIDSLSFLFDFGLSLQNANISQNGVKTNARNTSVDYVTIGFRAAPRLGMSVGLMPYSTIGYNTCTSGTVPNTNPEVTRTTAYSGDGGLHEVYYGLGWAPHKNLSFGANLGYLWGDLSHKVVMSYSESSVNTNRQVYETDVRSYKVDFGVQYVQPIDKKNTLTLGFVYGLGHDVNTRADFLNQSLVSGTVSSGDTLHCSNAYQIPHTFGAGITWSHNNSLRLGFDYTFQKWGSVKFPQVLTDAATGTQSYQAVKGQFTDMHKMALGVEYIPNPEGIRWSQHVRYRAGFSFSTPYITNVSGHDGPHDYQASLGVALPIMNMHNNRSLLNISAQYERVAPKAAGMITENYLRLCIGLSFNERWFMKWKVE